MSMCDYRALTAIEPSSGFTFGTLGHLTSKLSGRPTRPNRRRECIISPALAPQPLTFHGPLQRKLAIVADFEFDNGVSNIGNADWQT